MNVTKIISSSLFILFATQQNAFKQFGRRSQRSAADPFSSAGLDSGALNLSHEVSGDKESFSLSRGMDYLDILNTLKKIESFYGKPVNIEEEADAQLLNRVHRSLKNLGEINSLSAVQSSGYAQRAADQLRWKFPYNSRHTLLSTIQTGSIDLVKNYCGSLNEDYFSVDDRDFFARDEQGNTPLLLCLVMKAPHIFQFLFKSYKNLITLQNDRGDNVLHVAIGQKDRLSFDRILNSDLTKEQLITLVLTPNKLGVTPIVLAASLGYNQLVSSLLCLYKKYEIKENDDVNVAKEFVSCKATLLDQQIKIGPLPSRVSFVSQTKSNSTLHTELKKFGSIPTISGFDERTPKQLDNVPIVNYQVVLGLLDRYLNLVNETMDKIILPNEEIKRSYSPF